MAATVTVGIIGTGWVGSSVAISTLHAGIAQELLLHDARAAVAEGEAMDLAHGASFYPAATVRSADVDEMLAADAIVIAAGRGGRPDESRLDLLNDNARVIRALAERFRRYDGLVVIVTNPVDVLTFEFARASGLPHARVFGTGTMLDTARLRQMIGRTIGIEPQSVHAQVVGEHGDSEVERARRGSAAGAMASVDRGRRNAHRGERSDGGVRDHPAEGRDEPRDRPRDGGAAARGAARRASRGDGVARAGRRLRPARRRAVVAGGGRPRRRGAGHRAGDERRGTRGARAFGRRAASGDQCVRP